VPTVSPFGWLAEVLRVEVSTALPMNLGTRQLRISSVSTISMLQFSTCSVWIMKGLSLITMASANDSAAWNLPTW
jgi:hypothetical protein